jgi:chromosome segregation ATPase
MKSSQKDMEAAGEAVQVAVKALDAAREEEAEFEMKVGQRNAAWEEAKSLLDDIESKLKTCSQELSALSTQRAKLIEKAEAAEIEGKKLSVKINKFHSEQAKAEKFLKHMMSMYAWIETEKEAFGIAGGDYDFEETNPAEMSKHLKDLQAEQTSLVSLSHVNCSYYTTCLQAP